MTSKSNGSAASPNSNSKSELECCMCGDFGFSNQLFHCKICQFRFQHRYCSNLFPKADSYQICNWCLTLNQESKPKSPISSPIKNTNDHQIPTFQSQPKRPIKKQRPPELPQRPPPPPPRRKPLPVDDKLRRTRSEEMSRRSGVQRQVIFRNKVRRYKFLDEVST